MLSTNPLQPPRPFFPASSRRAAVAGKPVNFVTADAFDDTGVLAGVDPCESRYWWLPELYGPEIDTGAFEPDQATSRDASRASAAA